MLDKPRDMIITLVSGGYHIDYRNKQGYTGIHRAAQKNNYVAVKVQMFVILLIVKLKMVGMSFSMANQEIDKILSLFRIEIQHIFMTKIEFFSGLNLTVLS